MDERCKTCPRLCKRLDLDDRPVSYHFAKLSPEAVIALIIESTETEHRYWELEIEEHACATGHQTAVLVLKPRDQVTQALSPESVMVIVQAANTTSGTTLWFWYDVPEECCDNTSLVTELSEMINRVLGLLNASDLKLSSLDTVSVKP
jgi:hypothetical protein